MPKTRAGKAVLLTSLFFALIIYNSFSGYITSILSVKSGSIHNVSDFENYDYVCGCSKNEKIYISVGLISRGYSKTIFMNFLSIFINFENFFP